MIGSFPTPYPDELLYSVFARYFRLMGYHSFRASFEDLFGSSTVTAVIDLPNRLQTLVDRLPPGHGLSSDYLIDNHTQFPFYAPFLPVQRAETIRRQMAGKGGTSIHPATGIMASSVKAPTYLRMCPRCAERDQETYGETYWHRLHQLPCVLVCPDHRVFLADTSVTAANRTTRHGLYPAPDPKALNMIATPKFDWNDTGHRTLLRIKSRQVV